MKKALLLMVMVSFPLTAQAWGKALKKENVSAAKKAVKAATLSDDDMKKLSLESVTWMDENNPVAPDSDAYGERLKKLVTGLENEDGLDLNFKVYKVADVNAFATPDGSVRVMAGLMNLMTDDELRAVIGHEIGHVKLKHSKKQYQKAYAVSAAKDVAAANSGTTGQMLSDSKMGKFVEDVLNAKFSRKDESASDEYGFKFMVKHGYDYHAMASAFEKLAELSGGKGKKDLTASHPDAGERAKRAATWAKNQDKKK